MTQRVIEIDSPFFVDVDDLPPSGLQGLFPHRAPLALELGCGIGDFILQRARQQPDLNFLAIDIYNKGCLKTCRRLERADIENVRVMRVEARYLLHRFCEAGALAAVYINCPDPWPKKRHRKRRLVNEEFLLTLPHYLAPEAELFFASDVADYARQVAGHLAEADGFRNQLAAPFATELAGYPLSKYMRRFLEQGQPIHFIHARRDPAWRGAPAVLPAVEPGFRVNWSHAGNE